MSYLTPPQIAKLLKVRREKIVAWIKAGKLRAIDVAEGGSRNLYRVSQAALDDFEKSREVTPPLPQRRQQPPSVPDYFS